MARTVPTWLNAYAMPIEKDVRKQRAPNKIQLLKMTIDGYFDKVPRANFQDESGGTKTCYWYFLDAEDLGNMVLGSKMAKPTETYTPTKEFTQYVKAVKKCKVDSLGRPSTVAYLEEVGYPPFMLKVHSGKLEYTFSLTYVHHHSPVGPVDTVIPEGQDCICLCDKNGGIYINYATMTLMWQHRVFALCLTEEKRTMEEHNWAFVAEKQTKGAAITKGAEVIDVPYCIVGTDGLEMMHGNYTIP